MDTMSRSLYSRRVSGREVTRGPNSSLRSLSGSTDHFPHLPPYEDPTTGVLSKLPSSWIPFAQLMRLHRPAGFYAFYIPHLIGTLFAASIAPSLPGPADVLRFMLFLLPLIILLRGAACAWNDNVDQQFDRKVERCRHRPIARGAVSTLQGHIFTAALLAALWSLLVQLPHQCHAHMGIALVLFFLYALAKRVTHYAQVFLGFPHAWAIVFCVSAFGMDPFGAEMPATLTLGGASVLWTITWDTIYAHQDIRDDELAGVKGMAIRFRNSTKILSTFLLIGQLGLLVSSGVWARFGIVYFVGTVGGVAVAMAHCIYSVDLKSPASCGLWFQRQFFTVGAGYLAGLAGEYVVRLANFQ